MALLVTAGPGLLAAQSQVEDSPQKTNERIQQLATLARVPNVDPPLGIGDVIHIDVFDVPELSRDVRISDSGVIGFPLVHEPIVAAGLTTFQLERKMEQVLSAEGLVAHAQVSVFVKEQNSAPVSIVGAVGHQSVVQIVRPTTLLEVLAGAGGISDEAGSIIQITRASTGDPGHMQQVSEQTTDPNTQSAAPDATLQPHTETITIQLKNLLESGDPQYNIQILGGDIISVPRAGIIYVLGYGVAQQGEYVITTHGDQLTALKALAFAHGMTTFAKGDDSIIIRNDPVTGQRAYIPLHLKKIQNRKENDVPLQANDILFIPDSRGKKALARTTEAAIGIGTGLALFRIE
jgi:polysaccharide export outer membrane protein